MREYFWHRETLPSNWKVVRADSILEFVKKQISAVELQARSFFYYSIPAIQNTGDGIVEEGDNIDSNKFLIAGGELLIAKLNPEKGCVIITSLHDLPIVCSTEFVPLKPKKTLCLEFIYYIYSSDLVRSFLASKSQSSTRSHQRVNPSDITKLWLPYPSLAIQNQIVQYLNGETAHIDALISSKDHLLKLLTEKRKSLINQAVTKGLDPKVKMKDSKLAWLDKIPEHWEVIRLKFLGEIKYGLSQPPEYKDNGIPLVRATNVFRGTLIIDGLVYVDNEDLPQSKALFLKKGDIIVVRSGAYTGDSAIVTEAWDGSLAGFDMVIRPIDAVNPFFVSNALLSDYVLNCQLIPSSSRAAQPHLNAEELGSTIIVMPPCEEQEQIVKFIENQKRIIDEIYNSTQYSIKLLKERRSTLISAVVTGQIEIN